MIRLPVLIGERYKCPHCDKWENAIRYMPDNQGEFWLLCQDCNKASDLPDREIVAELEYLQIQIQRELGILLRRTDSRDYNPANTAKRVRKGPS